MPSERRASEPTASEDPPSTASHGHLSDLTPPTSRCTPSALRRCTGSGATLPHHPTPCHHRHTPLLISLLARVLPLPSASSASLIPVLWYAFAAFPAAPASSSLLLSSPLRVLLASFRRTLRVTVGGSVASFMVCYNALTDSSCTNYRRESVK